MIPVVDGSVVLLTKRDRFSADACAMAHSFFGERVECFAGSGDDPMPERLEAGVETLISFLSPWIIPKRVLDRCGTAINFHPGSVDYPGIGCYNFAIYDGAAEFGATCHHMLPKVDTGKVVLERRFPMFASDTVEILKLRTMVTMLSMFHDIATLIADGKPLPIGDTHWTREAYTRRQLNALTECDQSMTEAEIRRRVKASTYPGYPGAVMLAGGQRVEFPVPQRAAVA